MADDLRGFLLTAFDRYRVLIKELVAQGIEEGVLRPQDPLLGALVLMGLTNRFLGHWCRSGEEPFMELDQLLEEAKEYFMRACGAGSGI